MAKFILKNSIAITSTLETLTVSTISADQKYFTGGEPVELSKDEIEKIKKEFGEDFISEFKEEKKEEAIVEAVTEEAPVKEKKKS